MDDKLKDGELYFIKINGEVLNGPFIYDEFMDEFSDEYDTYEQKDIEAWYHNPTPDKNAEGWNVIHPR